MHRTSLRLRPASAFVAAVVLLLVATACGSGSSIDGGGGADATSDATPFLPDTSDDAATPADVAKPDGSQPDTAQPPDAAPADVGSPPADVPAPLDMADDTGGGGGDACDDGDPCTSGDHLVDGTCGGTAYACDDGKACTDDACDGAGGCLFERQDGHCLIDGVCFADGDGEPCRVCDASGAPTTWTLVEGDCDDGDACTVDDVCADGVCGGAAPSCDDQNACTDDTCDATNGCVHTPNASDCEDGDPCTDGDVCVDGGCAAGTPRDCDDDNDCTDDACDASGVCVHTPRTGGCDDGDDCTVGDVCAEGTCVGGGPVDCDDDNSCTVDTCDAAGCQHTLDTDNACCASGTNPCDDGNPCTDDVCDPVDQSCANPVREGVCSDGDACTTGDVCVAGECVADGVLACEDGNACTTDTCDAAQGCVYTALGEGSDCDDDDACTGGDVCTGGVCAGERLGCLDCPPEFWNPADAVTALAIGTDGRAGNGLDVDGNPTTCRPTGNCEAGIDNQFAQALTTLTAFIDVNAELAAAIEAGQISVLFEHRDPTFDGATYTLAAYVGDAVVNGCDPEVAACDYRVPVASLTEACDALLLFPNAQVVAGHLSAGGPGSTFSLSLPFLAGVSLDLTLYNARVEADVTTDGPAVTALLNGVLGGAVRQQQIIDIVTALPDELFASVPGGKGLVLTLLPSLFQKDIDTDGDGTSDATSIGLRFTAHRATITGVTP